jgi:hypothetical protein
MMTTDPIRPMGTVTYTEERDKLSEWECGCRVWMTPDATLHFQPCAPDHGVTLDDAAAEFARELGIPYTEVWET